MTQLKYIKIAVIGFTTILLLAFLVSPAFVEDHQAYNDTSKANPQEKKKVSPSETQSAGISAMKIGKDKDGAVRPTTPAEEKKLNAELQKTLSKYPKHSAKQNADGSISLVVAPHRLTATTAHVGPDGKVHINCVDHTGQSNHSVPAKTQQELSEE